MHPTKVNGYLQRIYLSTLPCALETLLSSYHCVSCKPPWAEVDAELRLSCSFCCCCCCCCHCCLVSSRRVCHLSSILVLSSASAAAVASASSSFYGCDAIFLLSHCRGELKNCAQLQFNNKKSALLLCHQQ